MSEEKRGPGRPRLTDPGEVVKFRIPHSQVGRDKEKCLEFGFANVSQMYRFGRDLVYRIQKDPSDPSKIVPIDTEAYDSALKEALDIPIDDE